MKKVGVLILAGILCLSLFGCGKSEAEKNQEAVAGAANEILNNMKNTAENADKIAEENKKIFEKKQKSLDDTVIEIDKEGYNKATVKLKSYVVISNRYKPEEKQLVLTMDYTNRNDRDLDFYNIVGAISVYQDGVRLANTSSEFDKDNGTYIKNGATIEVVYTYPLRNESSDVEFEVHDETVYTLKLK